MSAMYSQSESTASVESGEEGCLQALLDKERQLSAEKDVRIRHLELRVKALESELEKSQRKSVVKERDGNVAKAQQELLQELQKRKAVQYELISSGQQLCELQEKIYQQEKQLQQMGLGSVAPSVHRSPVLSRRSVSEGENQLEKAQLPQNFSRQMSDNVTSVSSPQASTCEGSPGRSGSSFGFGSPVPPSDRPLTKEANANARARNDRANASEMLSVCRRMSVSATQPGLRMMVTHGSATVPVRAPKAAPATQGAPATGTQGIQGVQTRSYSGYRAASPLQQ